MTKSILNFKFLLLITTLIFSIFFQINIYAENTSKDEEMITVGRNDSPVKIKVFSSHTCPHCASFHVNVFPKIEEKYIESGKVQIYFSYVWSLCTKKSLCSLQSQKNNWTLTQNCSRNLRSLV